MAGADLLANLRDSSFDKVRGGPIALCTADGEDEIADELRAERSVVHFGVKLHGPDFLFVVGDGGQCVGGERDAAEAGGKLLRLVAVAHPDVHFMRQIGEERRGAVFEGDIGVAVLALGARANLAAEIVHDEVQAVADAKHGQAQLEHGGVGHGRVSVIYRRGTAGEDDAEWLVGLDFRKWGSTGKNDGKDVLFADAAGNQLRILRAEVKDNDCLGVHVLVWQGRLSL